MKGSRAALWILVIVAMGSLIGVLLLGAALTDLWHLYGSRQVWTGAEPGKAEWRFVASSFWSLVTVHVAGLGVGARRLHRSRTTESQPSPRPAAPCRAGTRKHRRAAKATLLG